MPLGSFRLNGLAKFTVTAVAEVIRAKKGVTANGNAQVSTAQSQFGFASALFDGTGDYLLSRLDITGDYTYECWIRLNNVSGEKYVFRLHNSSDTFSYVCGVENNYLYVFSGGITTGGTLVTNTWYHIAFSRQGTSLRLFLNGTLVNTRELSINLTNAYLYLGGFSNNLGTNGYLDEIRVSNTARYTANFTSPTQPFVNDANTLLLIHANGTNGSTFFEDDNGSRSQNSLIASGTVTTSTAQSQFGLSSVLFDGAGNDHIFTGTDAPNIGSGNFTVEFWIYPYSNSAGSGNGVINKRVVDNVGAGSWGVRWSDVSSTRTVVWENIISPVTTITSSANPFNYNTWSHWAFVRNGSTLTIYVNGNNVGSGSNSINFTNVNPYRIGWWGTGTNTIGAYVDEIRVSNSARYTANFTPSTTPFVNDANTLLLLHMDGSPTPFNDDNGTIRVKRLAIPRGAASISTTQSRFGGSSIIFDGSTAHIDVVPASDFNFGTGNFTVEAWIYVNNVNTIRAIWGNGVSGFYVQTNRSLNFFSSATGQINGLSNNIPLNTWTHVALSRSSGTLRGFTNGVQQFSTTTSVNMTGITSVFFGGLASNDRFLGHMDEMRISSTARYTANFTAPTAAFTNDSNTLLLIHGDLPNPEQIAFEDDVGVRSKKAITAFGDARISTAQSQFGGASAVFDGTGDYLRIASDTSFAYGTNNFTIEFWIRFTSVPGSGIFDILFEQRPFGGGATSPVIFAENSRFQYNVGNTLRITGSTTILSNTWYHVSISRSETSTRLFINGTQEGTTFSDTSNYVANDIYVATDAGAGNGFAGHIDEIRVSNTARYTANFTAPTQPFQNDANTVLLIHMDGTNGSTIFRDDNGVTPTHNYS
jgi:hypothetical protein